MLTYTLYELNHALLSPMRAVADATRLYYQNPLNPLSHTEFGRNMSAACELFERSTRRYARPDFGIETTRVNGKIYKIAEETLWSKPFCSLLHFKKRTRTDLNQPKILLVAPMSGHYATLLRGTVEAFLTDHDVYITDWQDARMVPMADGKFDLDSYISYVVEMIEFLGEGVNVVAVCQPSVPVMAAVSHMAEIKHPAAPKTMILMGGPIDTRKSPTAVNVLAKEKGLKWFEKSVVMQVPFPYPGMMRKVYPGFLQLSGFMSMNLERHVNAHYDFYNYLIQGDGDSAEKHREFYDEYLAVMDMTAEFYLQTVDTVFIKHSLPKGTMRYKKQKIDPSKIKTTALLTIEGEKDDITGHGQTKAAHDLCTGLAKSKKQHYLQEGVGHYGVFNGTRFREQIVPVIREFILKHSGEGTNNIA